MLSKYQEDLEKLYSRSYDFAKNIEEAFALVVGALESKNLDNLKEAKNMLKGSSKEESKIDMRIIEILALYAPEAKDLRRVVTLMKITSEFSRISDYITAQIKTLTQEIVDEENIEGDGTRVTFYKSTHNALKASVEIIKAKDESILNELIREVSIEESKCDDFVSIIEKEIISEICDNKNEISYFAKRLNSVRKMERISDRCVNIAKLRKYAIEGGKLKL